MRSLLGRQLRLAAAGALLLGGLAGQAAASTAGRPAVRTASRPAATAAAAVVPRYQHIAVIVDTDHDYKSISGNRYAPVLNRLAREYGLAKHYYSVADPDVANEIAMLAGKPFGVADNVPYWGEQIHQPSLLSQLDAVHKSWLEYVQGLPYPGYLGNCYPTQCLGTPQTDTLYNQVKFNGVPDFAGVAGNPAEAREMVPATGLAADARYGRLPDFSLIIPDECDNMHGGPPWCVDGTSAYHEPNDNRLVSFGDRYIGQVTHEIMSGPQWRRGNNAIVITFTEGDSTAGCCDAKPGTGRVMTVVVTSHGPRGLVDTTPYNDYSLLATIQRALGVSCLQHTCDTKNVPPMARLFGGSAASTAAGSGGAAAGPAGAADPAGAAGPTQAAPTAARRAPGRAGPAAVSSWKRVASPNIGSDDNDLGAIAGRSPSDIWAVGALLPPGQPDITSTLAVHYNGKKWADVPTPDVGRQANILFGVAALSDGTAWAVGSYTQPGGHTARTLAEHWNGHRWTIVPSADPGRQDDVLYSVTARNDHDVWAVGTAASAPDGAFRTLIEHWNGHRWSVCSSPDPGAADDVLYSVTSAPGQGAWASGQELSGQAPDRQLILHLTGGSWQVAAEPVVRTPGGTAASAYPQAIAASPDGLWVAGNDRSGPSGFSTLVEAPATGGGLSELSTPNPVPQDNYLWGVASVGAGSTAWAVGNSVQPSTGNSVSLIEFGRADGGWRIVPSPDPGLANGGNTILGAVLAFGRHDVWAVGTYDGANGRRTLILHFAG